MTNKDFRIPKEILQVIKRKTNLAKYRIRDKLYDALRSKEKIISDRKSRKNEATNRQYHYALQYLKDHVDQLLLAIKSIDLDVDGEYEFNIKVTHVSSKEDGNGISLQAVALLTRKKKEPFEKSIFISVPISLYEGLVGSDVLKKIKFEYKIHFTNELDRRVVDPVIKITDDLNDITEHIVAMILQDPAKIFYG